MKKILTVCFYVLRMFQMGISPVLAQVIPLPLNKSVKTGTLANEFTYFIFKNMGPKNRFYLYLVSKVGSIVENERQRGLTHLVEHMNLNGTAHFPKNQLVDYLQKSGLRFRTDLNAYTGFDELYTRCHFLLIIKKCLKMDSASYSKILEGPYRINISLVYAPNNVECLIASVIDEIETLKKQSANCEPQTI